jgi:hypothetical protein
MNRVTTRETELALGWLVALSLAGCGAHTAASTPKTAGAGDSSYAHQPQSAYAEAAADTAAEANYPGEQPSPATPAPPPDTHPGLPPPSPPADRAPVRELMVYEATLTVAVYQVERGITDLLAIARALEGQVVQRGDDRLIFRVPRARFEEALARADQVGDVLHRNVHAEDVGDEFRDLEVRLRNARAMRDRLEHLLQRAGNVKDALEVEAQMSRVTEEIERLAGQLQLLGHRIAYSKITVLFQPRHEETLTLRKEVVRLPFPWLGSLGLGSLLELEE